ncbi:3431_t:CDS:2, partial [Dentiscutata erythropus]
ALLHNLFMHGDKQRVTIDKLMHAKNNLLTCQLIQCQDNMRQVAFCKVALCRCTSDQLSKSFGKGFQQPKPFDKIVILDHKKRNGGSIPPFSEKKYWWFDPTFVKNKIGWWFDPPISEKNIDGGSIPPTSEKNIDGGSIPPFSKKKCDPLSIKLQPQKRNSLELSRYQTLISQRNEI